MLIPTISHSMCIVVITVIKTSHGAHQILTQAANKNRTCWQILSPQLQLHSVLHTAILIFFGKPNIAHENYDYHNFVKYFNILKNKITAA